MVALVTVCICTYRRPELLGRLLTALLRQDLGGALECAIVIVDNDRSESARATVEAFERRSSMPVTYCIEPEQNIALARNRAVTSARGDFVALIDDDEFPDERWLATLHDAACRYRSDGVLGPVLPHFETDPPDWVLKGRFFERPAHASGEVLDWRNTRTGNAFLRRELFECERPFDPQYGSGGEDRDFFRRKIGQGRTFVWCNEAAVHESIPPARWKRSTLLKRALLRGRMAFVGAQSKPMSVSRSVVAVVVYTAGLPLFLILGQHVLMKYLIKDCDHLGKVLAAVGVDLVKEKYVGAG